MKLETNKEVQSFIDRIEAVYRVDTVKRGDEYLRQLKLAARYIQVLEALVPAHFDYTKTKEYKQWNEAWKVRKMYWLKRKNWTKVAISTKI